MSILESTNIMLVFGQVSYRDRMEDQAHPFFCKRVVLEVLLTCGMPIPSVSNIRAITTDAPSIAPTIIAIAKS